MADSSWDDGGQPVEKKRMGTGMKVMVGCGIASGLLLVTCVLGGTLLQRTIAKDPQGFERKVEAWAEGFVKEDWARAQKVMESLQTDEGARKLYRENPALATLHGDEAAFLAKAKIWRPRLGPLPADGLAARDQSLDLNKDFWTTRIRYRYPDGTRLSLVLKKDGAVESLSVSEP